MKKMVAVALLLQKVPQSLENCIRGRGHVYILLSYPFNAVARQGLANIEQYYTLTLKIQHVTSIGDLTFTSERLHYHF